MHFGHRASRPSGLLLPEFVHRVVQLGGCRFLATLHRVERLIDFFAHLLNGALFLAAHRQQGRQAQSDSGELVPGQSCHGVLQ